MTDLRTIPGYTLHSSLHDGSAVGVWRGVRVSDGLPVIIKATKGGAHPPHAEEAARLRAEYEVSKALPIAGVVRAIDFMEVDGTCVLVQEDPGGTSLRHAMRESALSLEDALVVASEVARTLAEIHAHNVVHKDLRPDNIILEKGRTSVRIAGLGIASVVLRSAQHTASVQRPETMAYISPEQTGRMNCRLDWRSDLYSLGVSLFELFTGKLPFPVEDPLALVYAHIAKNAPSASEANPLLPPVIAAIIAKLMAKSPDERYQSATGLQRDLLLCLEYHRSAGDIPPFPLGRHDVSDKFHIPHKLVGREQELARLLTQFDSAAKGRAKLAVISGPSGIGKSALVQGLVRSIIERNGYFISGKFDQVNRNIPYSSLIQAFQQLIRQVLSGSSEHVLHMKGRIMQALGARAQVIVNVIPELTAIIGQQPRVAELPAAESQNRFTTLFLKFAQVFATRAHPLCLFLDDLHWADHPSLKLIAEIVADSDTRHMLLLGAFRDNEVDPAHPLPKVLQRIEGMGVDVDTLPLGPLGESDVCRLIQATFNCTAVQAEPFAELCVAKTGGNPFFLSQILRKLYESGIVAFDPAAGAWQWDVEKIRGMEIADNVVALMAERILYFSDCGKTALKLAACVGNTFPLALLARISGKTNGEMLGDLAQALSEGLIMPCETAPERVAFRFLHDRVQQAAYSLFNEEERLEAHLKVGRMLLDNVTPAEWRTQLFDIVSHLNAGAPLIVARSERTELARLNLEAGKKAKDSGAFEPGYRFLEAMARCLPEDPWESAYVLTLEYHMEHAEAAYLCGHYQEAYALCNAAFSHVRELLDRVRVCEVVILAYRSEGKNRDAVNCARAILEELGERYPARVRERHLIAPILTTKWLLRGKTDADLLSLPPLHDPYKQAILRVMTKAGSSVYITDPLLAALWIFGEMKITLRYGRSPVTAYAYSVYGLLLCGALREYDEGNRFARLAHELIQRDSLLEAKAKTLLACSIFVQVWRTNQAHVESVLWKTYEHALAEGDVEFAAISLYSVTQSLPWICGELLPVVSRKMEEHDSSFRTFRQDRVNQWSAIYRQAVWNCQSPDIAQASSLNGQFADEQKILANCEAHGDRVGQAHLFVNKLILCVIFREFAHAPAYVKAADEHAHAMAGQLGERQYHLYTSLALLAGFDAMPHGERRAAARRARASLRVLREMESNASVMSHHAPCLLEAELMRTAGDFESAGDLYDAAIRHARECRHHYEEALANELCGRFYLARAKAQIAEAYLQRAFIVYRNWGATGKLLRMPALYPSIGFPRLGVAERAWGGAQEAATSATAEAMQDAPASPRAEAVDRHLDLATVLKATRAISGEIVLSRLLEELLRIVLENAGAQRGLLLLDEDDELVVEGEIGGGHMTVLQSARLDGYPGIARTVVNYVKRTRNSVVLEDAQREGDVTQDPYLASGKVRSLLCMPVMNKGEFTGILYLEHNTASGAFTMDRVDILNVIMAQIAISIENARLYESIERKVDERTRQLQDQSELLNQVNREMAHEIEQRKMLEGELRRLATTDSLTGLLVRRRLFEIGETEISRAKRNGAPLSLMLLDLDHFKDINDSHGHAVGDEVLKRFSAILCSSLRNVDIVCRFGGEEFVAILPDTAPEVAVEVARRLRENVEASPLDRDGVRVGYTVSVGLAALEAQDTKLNQLIKRADEALYHAKKSGRNRVVFAPPAPSTLETGA